MVGRSRLEAVVEEIQQQIVTKTMAMVLQVIRAGQQCDRAEALHVASVIARYQADMLTELDDLAPHYATVHHINAEPTNGCEDAPTCRECGKPLSTMPQMLEQARCPSCEIESVTDAIIAVECELPEPD